MSEQPHIPTIATCENCKQLILDPHVFGKVTKPGVFEDPLCPACWMMLIKQDRKKYKCIRSALVGQKVNIEIKKHSM